MPRDRQPSCSRPGIAPVFLLAGGPGRRRAGGDPVLEQVFALSGRRAPSIAYVGVASDDDAGFRKWLTARFRASGSGPVTLAAMAAKGDDLGEARRVLEEADIVYVSGGDVEAGMAHLRRCRMEPLLRRLHGAGKPFFGLSAGSIMLARQWVRWSDPDDDDTAGPFSCLGLAPVLCDCHAEADDWVELHALLRLQRGDALGYGIPTGGALAVAPDGSVRAVGAPAVRLSFRAGRISRLADLAPPAPPGADQPPL